MTFDDWMRARNPKYCPTDDTVALRELRDCWITAEHHSARAQEREQIIELMREATGEERDPDTGLHHAAHTAWNALARLDLALRKTPNAEFRPTHAASSREVAPGTQG